MEYDEKCVYKQDIDDNCPMTGDDEAEIAETEEATQLSDGDSNLMLIKRNPTEIAPMNPTEIEASSQCTGEEQFSTYVEDEEESFSSDRNCFSDEETSSFGESFDDLGRDEGEEDSASEPISEKRREEKLRLIALRKHLDELGELVVERENAVHQSKSELQKCREYLNHLEEEVKTIGQQIIDAEQKGQKALHDRLKRKYEKLLTEIDMEKEVNEKCLQNLEDAEFYLAQTYIEHGKFLPIYEELEQEEKRTENQKVTKANARIKKEVANAIAVERRKKSRDKEHISTVRERERKNRQAVIAAKKNREVAMKYLKDTMLRIRQKESEEEDKSRTNLNKRMNALLSLKRNIEFNKENMSALQACNHHHKKQENITEKMEREKLESLGENPDEVLTRRKRIRQFEQDKEAFERKQREREIEIVNKIISEEKQMKKRYQQQPQLWPGNKPRRVPRRRLKPQFAPSSGSESMEYGADVEDTGGKLSYVHKASTDEEGEFSPYGATNRDDDDDKETTEDDDIDKDDDKDLAEPEFKGLWEQDDNIERKTVKWKTTTHEYSKYEQEMMKNALLKQKQNIVQKQVAAGREFKGVAFYSKPEIVLFKDFDVGKKYHVKVLLTNVSYSQNYCQYVGLTEKLKDFIDVSFVSPGPMSAGLTCDLSVSFNPMINEDLEGRIEMMAQTGLFYIPIRCLKKRCDVKVDITDIDFENQVVGETRKKAITLKNCGALGTDFEFLKVTKTPQKKDLLKSKVDAHAPNNVEDDDDRTAALRTGRVSSGTLAPFSAVQLEIIFSPKKPSYVESIFVASFSAESVNPIDIIAHGTAIDLPVWVERDIVDLRVCMYDRLYQDAVIVSNRATSALQIRFELPKELRSHVDVLPKTAFIQAESQFSAQLKFLPRKSLSNDAPSFYNLETGKFEVPVVIHVADQTQPVPFTVTAMVTSSDLEFDVSEVNFGTCTVYETVCRNFKLVNKSVLPQQFGFLNTPDEIDVQPNDGFGTILPNEKLDLEVMFSPGKAKEYRFGLSCKSEIGREFILQCRGVGVLPPLRLSENLIEFRATAINDSSSIHFFVVNDHTSTNQFTHPVPRIGSGNIFPVGPTSFQFMVPDDAPITISPCVGTVLPGDKAMVYAFFSPKLGQDLVRKKVEELVADEESKLQDVKDKNLDIQESKINKSVSQQSKVSQKLTPGISEKNIDGHESKGKGKGLKSRVSKLSPPVSENKSMDQKKISKEHQLVSTKRAELLLLKSYENTFSKYKIPCCIGYGECGDPGKIQYDPRYTIYLEVYCPAVRPTLIAFTETGDNLLDFGKVSLGQKSLLVISVQNISDCPLALTSKALDPLGPFDIVNALRSVDPGGVFSMKVSFTPIKSEEFYEVLELVVGAGITHVRLKGQGIKPKISLDPSDSLFDVGDALVMDSVTAPLRIKNISELPMEFSITLGSISPLKHDRTQAILKCNNKLLDNSFVIGAGNKSGISPFGCKPCYGKLDPNESKEIEIIFSPDHPSELYRDELCLNISGAEEFTRVHLIGRGWPSMTYAKGWDKLGPSEESLGLPSGNLDSEHEKLDKTVLMTFHSILENSKFSMDERKIELGCIRSVSTVKKSCDYSIEIFKDAKDLGFSVEPLKGGIDIGTKKQLQFLWEPPDNYDPQEVAKASIQLIMRGDVHIEYTIMLRGFVKTN